MRDIEFKNWLEKRLWKGAPLKPHAIRNRLARVNRVERVLKAMGYPDNNIDQVLESGGVDELLTKLNADTGAKEGWLKDLVPKAKDPSPHLRNMLAATRQYCRFANGEDAQSDNGDDDENLPEDENDDDDRHLAGQKPTNLILYGPPGTGKT
jgi:5-methylcytosine-specific restriction protein B